NKLILQQKNKKYILYKKEGRLIIQGDLFLDGTTGIAGARRKSHQQVENKLISPMPGKIFKLMVKEGDEVNKNQVLMILEAMKMEHAIKAPYSGIVKKIFYRENEMVQGGKEL